jgi:hypothetical protein
MRHRFYGVNFEFEISFSPKKGEILRSIALRTTLDVSAKALKGWGVGDRWGQWRLNYLRDVKRSSIAIVK